MAVPTQPSFIPSAWAEGGQYNNIPAMQANPGDGSASWATGFPIENTLPASQGGVPAQYKDFQGVLHALSRFAQFQQAGGIFAWSADIDYPVGAVVLGSDGNLYKSIQASSPSDPQDPTTATAYWTIADPTAFLPLSGGIVTGDIARKNASGTRTAYALHYYSSSDLTQFGWKPSGNNGDGARLSLYSADSTQSDGAGHFTLVAANDSTYKGLVGKTDGTLTWDGQPIQTSSDERLKTRFSTVPDDVLDAWGKVNWEQFKYKESVTEKGEENSRWHPGLVAQKVKSVFETEGLDACAYGILCYDKWGDEYEDVEVVDTPETKNENGETIPAVTHIEKRLIQEAGDLWTVRYEEALAMEAIYQRRRADRLEDKISSLEERLAAVEASLAAVKNNTGTI